MNRELIDPNAHIALVHFPIALLVVGVLLELFSFLGWRNSGVRGAARWMILIGAMLGVPTALSGVYALLDVREAWPIEAEVYDHFKKHILLSSLATILALLTCTLWIGLSDRGREILYWPGALCLAAAVVMMGLAANFGGHLVYEHGIAVLPAAQKLEDDQSATLPATQTARGRSIGQKIALAAPPLQTHTILAGAAVAFAVVSLGVSSRAMLERRFLLETSSLGSDRSDGDVIASTAAHQMSAVEAYQHLSASERITQISGVRPAPIALLAALLGVLAALAGIWFLAHDSDVTQWAALWNMISDRAMNEGRWLTRRLAHVICGVSIVLLPLVVLAVARIAPRAQVVWLVLSVLLFVAIAAQVWLGVVMMFDEERAMGPVTGW